MSFKKKFQKLNSQALMVISPEQEKQTGKAFAFIIESIHKEISERHIKNFTLIDGRSLARFYLTVEKALSEKDAIEELKKAPILSKEDTENLKKIDEKSVTEMEWEKLKEQYKETFADYLQKFDTLITEDAKFKLCAETISNSFANERFKKHKELYKTDEQIKNLNPAAFNYLREETAMMGVFVKMGFDYEIYPGDRNDVMDIFYNTYFSYSNKLKWNKITLPTELVKSLTVKKENLEITGNSPMSVSPDLFQSFMKRRDGLFENAQINEFLIKLNLEIQLTTSTMISLAGQGKLGPKELSYFQGQLLEMISNLTNLATKKESHDTSMSAARPLQIKDFKEGLLHEQILKKVKELAFDELFFNLPVSFYWMDREGLLLGCNEEVLASLDIKSINHFIGKHSTEIVTNKAWLNSVKVMESGTPLKTEEIHTKLNNEQIIYLSIKTPIFDDANQVIGLLGISVDITENRNAEELKKEAAIARERARAEEEIRQAVMILAGSIAHDLRNPIFNISSAGHFVKEALPTLLETYYAAEKANLPIANPISHRLLPELNEIVDSINETANTMNTFINDTLKALSRVLTGDHINENLVICQLDHAIDNTLRRYPFVKHERELIQWQRQNHFSFLGNPVLFSRIIINIVKNSLHQIHQHKQGQIFISAETGHEINILRIKDTAGGVPPEMLEHLFEGYKTTKKEGTGIGLPFCRLTMRSFGGDITCHSVFGEYIEFVLSFPRVVEENQINTQSKSLEGKK